MDKISKIKVEIERLKEKSKSVKMDTEYTLAWLLDFTNSLQEKPVSEDLEEASKEWLRPQLDKSYANYGEVKMMELTHFDGYAMLDAIEFGANWQEEQFEKNRLAACDAQTKEEAEREMDFVEKMIMEEHRQPTYSDAIEYGMRKMKEQMLKDSIDATIEHMPNDYGEFRPCIHVKVDRSFKKGEKVKVIIMKEE